MLAGLVSEHGEDRRLGDEAGNEAQRLGRESSSLSPPLVNLDRGNKGPRELTEPVPESHLVEGVKAAGLQPIAAEGALEVGMALQQIHLHTAPRQKIGESRSRWPCTNNDDSSDRHCYTSFLAELVTIQQDGLAIHDRQRLVNDRTAIHRGWFDSANSAEKASSQP
jgi:hypothetical protein